MVMNTDGNKFNRLREALRDFSAGTDTLRATGIRSCSAGEIAHTSRLSITPATVSEDENRLAVEEQMRAASQCGKGRAAYASRKYFLLLLVAGCRYLHQQRQSA